MQVTRELHEDPVHDEGELRARGRRDLVHDRVLAALAAAHGVHSHGDVIGEVGVAGLEDEVGEVVVAAGPQMVSLGSSSSRERFFGALAGFFDGVLAMLLPLR